jgi:hypothetical protein
MRRGGGVQPAERGKKEGRETEERKIGNGITVGGNQPI